MIPSSSQFDLLQPCWQDYLPYLNLLTGRKFPSCNQLNELLPAGLSSRGGPAIRFVPSEQLADDGYEHRIYTTGQVSTRADSWHDLFNALVWIRYPNIKLAMNSLHYRAGAKQKNGSRGRLRDALTLFDECGVIVISSHLEILEALSERRWSAAFRAQAFGTLVTLSVCGHAMLEKYLSPYKAMTAKALYVHVDRGFLELPRPEILEHLDRELARLMLDGQILEKPAGLSPLPLAGVPGWWPADEQNDDLFYADLQVFRPAPPGLIPARVISL